MANELDYIRANVDCPKCGREFSVTYLTLRLSRTVECQGSARPSGLKTTRR